MPFRFAASFRNEIHVQVIELSGAEVSVAKESIIGSGWQRFEWARDRVEMFGGDFFFVFFRLILFEMFFDVVVCF